MIIKMIKNLENGMEKMQESITKDLEDLKNKHIERNNTITEIKSTLEGIIAGYLKQKWISQLKDKMAEATTEEQNKVKKQTKK